jgi:hypothetical protein
MVLFAVNPKRPMIACAEAAGLPLIGIGRTLDPGLFELNERGAFNGHIPITAINSFIAVAAAYVHGFDAVVLSNERSAEEGNTRIGNRVVNHQYSKTAEFEADLQHYLEALVPNGPRPKYFSLLRPLAELHIAHMLARTTRYDDVFTSCNRSFKLRGEAPESRWCGACPKCHFVFLILATAMAPQRLEKIFGRNLLDDPGQLAGYEELTGLSGIKPWECVGELAESGAALIRLSEDEAWAGKHVVAALAPRLREKMPNHRAVWEELLRPASPELMPAHFREILNSHV